MTDQSDQHVGALAAELSEDGSVLTVTVPITINRRGGRKRIVTPDSGPDWAPARRHVESALVKALARAFRWREILENGSYTTIAEIAAAEKISQSYVRRLLRLTLLSPTIVEAILDGQAVGLQLEDLREEFPVKWAAQTLP